MTTATPNPVVPLSRSGCLLILAVGFLGWLFAGLHMSITQLVGQSAAVNLLEHTGALDAARYQELSRRAKALGGAHKLPGDDKSQLDQWRTSVTQWYAWY